MTSFIVFLLVIAVVFLFVALNEAKQSVETLNRLTGQLFKRLGSMEAELKTMKAEQAATVASTVEAEAATILSATPPPLPVMDEPVVQLPRSVEPETSPAATSVFPPVAPMVEIAPPVPPPVDELVVNLPATIQPAIQEQPQDITPKLEVAALEVAPVAEQMVASHAVIEPPVTQELTPQAPAPWEDGYQMLTLPSVTKEPPTQATAPMLEIAALEALPVADETKPADPAPETVTPPAIPESLSGVPIPSSPKDQWVNADLQSAPADLVLNKELTPPAPTRPPLPPVPHAAPPLAPPAPKGSFEMRLGTYWLVRIGIVMLLTGLVFLGNYAYKNWIGKLGPGGKVSLLYLASGALLGLGAWLYRREKKESVKNYAQVLFAGGLAAVYFTTYAAYWLPNLRVIASVLVDGALLLAWAGYIVWLADRRKSEVLALFAIGLAYYTSFITNVGAFTLYSNLVLTSAAVFFLVRNRWATLSLASLVATYAGFAFWRFHHHADGAALTSGELWMGNGFLSAYWVLFTAAIFLSRSESLAGARRAAFASVNNAAFFSLVLLSMMHVDHVNFWLFSLCYGAAQLALAALARRFLPTEPAVKKAFLTQGTLLVTVGFIAKFSGLNLALVLAAESVALRILSQQQDSFILRAGALVTGVLALCWGVADVREFDGRSQIVGATVGGLMLFNAWWSGRGGEAGAKERSMEQNFFTALALLMWATTTWRNTAPGWLALAFAVESTLFVVASGRLANKALWFGAFPFAGLAAVWGVTHQMPSDATVLWTGAGVGALLLFNAGWGRASRDTELALIQTHFFSVLALLMWGATTWNCVPGDWRAEAFAVESAAFLIASRPLKNLVLEFGSYAAALFAVGFVLLSEEPFANANLWGGTVVGALLLLNSSWRLAGSAVPIQSQFFTVLALATWGTTTWKHTSGDWRALAFAVESVLFLVASGRLANVVLAYGAFAFALLAVGWGSPHQLQFDTTGLWTGTTIGALLLFNATWERKSRDPAFATIQTHFFSVLALLMWGVTTWNNVPSDLRPFVFAVESTLFLVASRPLRNLVLEFGAYGVAALAVGWGVTQQVPFNATGLWTGVAVGGLLLFNASWSRDLRTGALAAIQTNFFSVLALLMWGVTTWNNVPSDWRALVFAIESTAFLVASRPLRNLVLEEGAYLVALFAAGLVVWTMKPIGTVGLAGDVVTGGLLLANSFLGLRHPRVAGQITRQFQVNFFTVLALLVWLWTTWRNTAAEYRGLLIAMESVALLVAGQRLGSLALVVGGRVFGALAVAAAGLQLMERFDKHTAVGWAVAWPHALTGALMLGNALIERRKRTDPAGPMALPVTFFTGLALAMWLATTWCCAPGELLPPLLAAEALVFTASLSVLELAELTLFGQVFLFIAQLTCAGMLAGGATAIPWWNPALVIAATLAHEHWWQRARSHPWLAQARAFLLGAHALAATALLFLWLHPQFSAPHWLGFSSLLALVLTGYGAMTRAWFLAGAAQFFLAASVFEFLSQLYFDPSAQKPGWLLALAPIVTLITLSQTAMRGLAQADMGKTRLAEQIGLVALVYRVTAVVLSLGWVFRYIPAENRFAFLALAGAALFAWSGWRQSREALWAGAVFTLMGLLLFILEIGTAELADWTNLPAILLLLAQQRAARRFPDRYVLPEAMHTAAIIVGTCSVWLFISSCVTLKAGGFDIYLTASWAGLALVVFVTGFGCRERIYRWQGLGVLACAIARVFIFDVWKLETIYRILSFMALGVVLMVLGFIYNKYEEKIKEWL